MKNPKAKGGAYEREICKMLSLWWTQDLKKPRDDIFYRSASSGGRSTQRQKKGLSTFNSAGDICALDPIGLPFLKFAAVEIKRGYSRCTFADLLDKPKHAATQEYEKWIEQAEQSAEQSKSYGWLIITRRNKKDAIVLFPKNKSAWESYPHRRCVIDTDKDTIMIVRLSDWLERTQPDIIRKLV